MLLEDKQEFGLGSLMSRFCPVSSSLFYRIFAILKSYLLLKWISTYACSSVNVKCDCKAVTFLRFISRICMIRNLGVWLTSVLVRVYYLRTSKGSVLGSLMSRFCPVSLSLFYCTFVILKCVLLLFLIPRVYLLVSFNLTFDMALS